MITSTRNPEHLKQIAGFVPKIKDAPYSSKEFVIWLIKNNDEFLRVWVDLEEEKVKSFMIAQIVHPLIEDELFIPLAFVDPRSDGICGELLKRAEGWAMSRGIRKISTYVKDREKALEKKYGFKFEHIGLVKELNY